MIMSRSKLAAIVVSFILLSTAVGVWVWSLRSPSSITITPQSLSEAYSYEISVDGFTYYAKNGTTGQIDYSGANSTTVFSQAMVASDNGSSIYIKSGTYGQIFLNKDVSLIGEGISTTPAAYPSDPDDMITGMSGVVISITTANTNALTINGTRSNINIKNIGIHFTGSGTGYGVYSPAGNNIQGLMYSNLDNIFVWGHDANHYAFYLVNMQHCTTDRLYSFGGPAFHVETISTAVPPFIAWSTGISNHNLLYARVPPNCTMTKSTYEFIGTSVYAQVAGVKIERLHCMDKSGSDTAASLYLKQVSDFDIKEVDIENTNNQLIKMQYCNQVHVYGALMLGGNITHTGCSFCGYYAGHAPLGTYSATTDSGSDFMYPQFDIVTTGTVTFPRTISESDFTIYQVGSMFYANNGATGTEIYSTNSSEVFTKAINSLPAYGGTITVKSGTYVLGNTWLINRTGVTITGEGATEGANKLEIANGVNSPVLNITGNYVTIRNLAIDGNKNFQSATTDAVAICGAEHVLFERVILNGGRYCLNIMGGGDDNDFRDCGFLYANQYGAYVKDAIQAIFDNCHFRSIGYPGLTDVAGVVFDGACISCTVTNCQFNFVRSQVGETWYGYGIEELGASMVNMQYIGNSGYGVPLGLSSHLISNSVTFKENTYYHTGGIGDSEQPTGTSESSGSLSNSTATTFSITHGLFGIPTGVWCSFNNTAVLSYSWTATSSIITVTVTGAALPAAMTCYWSAEYRP